MDTVLKWYNLSFKGKYNRIFYYLFGLTDRMPAEQTADFVRRLGAPESIKRKFPNEASRSRDVMASLSAGICVLKKSEVFRLLELLTQEGRLYIMARTPFRRGEKGRLGLHYLRREHAARGNGGRPEDRWASRKGPYSRRYSTRSRKRRSTITLRAKKRR